MGSEFAAPRRGTRAIRVRGRTERPEPEGIARAGRAGGIFIGAALPWGDQVKMPGVSRAVVPLVELQHVFGQINCRRAADFVRMAVDHRKGSPPSQQAEQRTQTRPRTQPCEHRR